MRISSAKDGKLLQQSIKRMLSAAADTVERRQACQPRLGVGLVAQLLEQVARRNQRPADFPR